jgi:hypothetical protein
MQRLFVLSTLFTLALAGCSDVRSASIDQDSLCTCSNQAQAAKCREGQLSFFQPATFGNEQLPLIAAAQYCDFRHQVMHTQGGVVCIYTARRQKAGNH